MSQVTCASSLQVTALPGVPRVEVGADLGQLVREALGRARLELCDCDVLVVTSKVFSRSQGRFFDLSKVEAGPAARTLGEEIGKDPRVVELILRESAAVSRKAKQVLVVRHRLGFITANAGIDLSNAVPTGLDGEGPWALLLPEDPDGSARALRAELERWSGKRIGVVVSDSHGRPFREGTVGAAIGVAGLPALFRQIGNPDLDGRKLEQTITALADQVAATADLVAGQAAEGRPFVLVRGLTFEPVDSSARALLRPFDQDLYA